jgi:hypothetical protein
MYATASSQLTNALFANAAIVLASSELFFVGVPAIRISASRYRRRRQSLIATPFRTDARNLRRQVLC